VRAVAGGQVRGDEEPRGQLVARLDLELPLDVALQASVDVHVVVGVLAELAELQPAALDDAHPGARLARRALAFLQRARGAQPGGGGRHLPLARHALEEAEAHGVDVGVEVRWVRDVVQAALGVALQLVELDRPPGRVVSEVVHVGHTLVDAGDVLPAGELASAFVHVVELCPEAGRELALQAQDELVRVRAVVVRIEAEVLV
jgi:hypothetical protein